MPAASAAAAPLALVFGDDSFSVSQRARSLYQQWTREVGGEDHEVIDATASASGEALRALGRLRLALQTLPFFGDAKVIWFKDCNFMGTDRLSETKALQENLASLAGELKQFDWRQVRLVISAGGVDKRRTFYKTLEKVAQVQAFVALSAEDSDWMDRVQAAAESRLHELGKTLSEEALGLLATHLGPNLAAVPGETEKLALLAGDRKEIQTADVEAVVTRGKHARAFAVGEALGNRDLPGVLRALDNELWQMQFDKKSSEIGLLYGLITKVKALLLVREMHAAGLIKPERNFGRFKIQWDKAIEGLAGGPVKTGPFSLNPYVAFFALPQSAHYTREELVKALDLLLEANFRLVSSGLDEKFVLQQTVSAIVARAQGADLN